MAVAVEVRAVAVGAYVSVLGFADRGVPAVGGKACGGDVFGWREGNDGEALGR